MEEQVRARDEWLALRCQANEPGAFEALVASLERPLLYYLYQCSGNQDVALELLQDVWIRAIRGVRGLKNPGSLRPWLYGLAHGIFVDHVRKDRARNSAELTYSLECAEVGTEDLDMSALDAGQIHAALGELAPHHREAIVLHFLEDFSISEIASITRTPGGTVKSRIHYAKAQLRRILSKGGYGPRI